MTDAKKMTREEYNLEMGAFCVCPKELLMEAHVQEGGNYSVKVLIGTPENIACFLMKNAAAREIVITDLLDRPVVTAFGCFLDRCRDDALRNSILSYLLPMQQGEKSVKDVFTPAREQFEAWYAEHPEHQFVGKPANAAVTEKMIRRGLAKGIVKIIDSPHDGEPACQMGDYWFYFAGMEGAGESAEEYLAHSDIDDVIREITDAINSLDENERGYYTSLLNEAGIFDTAKPYVVYVKNAKLAVVYAENSHEAKEYAESLCECGLIDLNCSVGREVASWKASKDDLEKLEVLNEH